MKHYHKNPRQITGKQFGQLGEWLDELGDLSGIVHDLNSDEIIGGNQRSRVFNINHCEIVLTETHADPDAQGTVGLGYVIWRGNKYAYRQVRWNAHQCEKANIVANKAGGTWDFDALANTFDTDDLLAWGFEAAELGLDETPAEVKDAEAQIDRAEELRQKWQVESGQLWQLGEHRLICGDCTDAAVVARVMGDDKADCTVTDPPYGVGVEYSEFDDTPDNVKELIANVMPIILGHLPAALTPGVPAMWDYPRPAWVGAWVHPASTSSSAWGFVGANPILYYGKDPYLSAGKGRRDSSLVSVADRKGEDDHPVSKPMNVWAWLVERMTPNIGAVVFDPFSGSGTTILACESLGRKCRAVEIAPAYVAVALQRWADATGGTPVLIREDS